MCLRCDDFTGGKVMRLFLCMKIKNSFSTLCYLLSRVLPVSADFLMSSAGGNENTSEAIADRPFSLV